MTTANFWGDRFHYYCNNGHTSTDNKGEVQNEPIEFVEQHGKSFFYACPKYFEVDETHPLGFLPGYEHQCFNNLGVQDSEKILNHLMAKYEEQLESGMVSDLTNYSFKVGQIDVTVLLHDTDDQIYLGIVNNKALNKNR